MPTTLYECSACTKSGYKDSMIVHFLYYHVPKERVPWLCSICKFRAASLDSIEKHENYPRHKEALRRSPEKITNYSKSNNPYKVEIGTDILIYRQDKPKADSSEYYYMSEGKTQEKDSAHPSRSEANIPSYTDRGKKRLMEHKADAVSKRSKSTSEVEVIRERSDTNSSRKARRITDDDKEGSKPRERSLSRVASLDDSKRKTVPSQENSRSIPRTTGTSKSEKSGENQIDHLLTTKTIKKERSISSESVTGDLPQISEESDTEDMQRQDMSQRDITQVLDHLKNMSKALVALDYHLRKLVPAVEQLNEIIAKGARSYEK